MTDPDTAMAAAVLRVASQVIDGTQRCLTRQGFTDLRPVHGLAMTHLVAAPDTASGLAAYLGLSKQAAALMVDHLVDRGYVRREPDPDDRRVWVLVPTERGLECVAAAECAAGEAVRHWREELAGPSFDQLQQSLTVIAVRGRLRLAL